MLFAGTAPGTGTCGRGDRPHHDLPVVVTSVEVEAVLLRYCSWWLKPVGAVTAESVAENCLVPVSATLTGTSIDPVMSSCSVNRKPKLPAALNVRL